MVRRPPLSVLGLALAVVVSLPFPLPCLGASAVEEPLLAILVKDPGNPSALANLGRLAWRRGEKEKARDYFRTLVTARPDLLLGQAGLALTSLDRPEAAVAALSQGGKEAGADQGIRDLTQSLLIDIVREALTTKGAAAVAAAAATRALPLAGENTTVMFLGAQAFAAAGRHAEARDLLERASLLSPDDIALRRFLDEQRTALAIVKINRQEYADAFDLLGMVKEWTPSNPRLGPLRALALYGMERRADAAAAGIAAARGGAVPKELAPALHAILFNLGVLAQQEERESEALAAYEAAWAVNPADTETGTILAGLYEKVGRTMEAVQVLQKVVAGAPDDATAQTLLTNLSIRMYNEGAARGKEAWEQGNLREALRYLTQAIAIKPRDADAGYYLDKTVARLRDRLRTLRERTTPPWSPKDLSSVVVDLAEAVDLETALAGRTDDPAWAGPLRAQAMAERTAEGKRQAALAAAALREGRPAEAWTAATLVKALGEGAEAAMVDGWLGSAEKAIENLGNEPLSRAQRAFDQGDWTGFASAAAEAHAVIPRELPMGEKLRTLTDEVDRRAHEALAKAEEALLAGDFPGASAQVAAALAYRPGWDQADRVRDEITRSGKVGLGDRLVARARVYSDLGEFALASEILQEAKRVSPEDPLVAQAQADLAVTSSMTVVADGLAAAELAARSGDLEAARRRYQTILQGTPDNAEAAGGLRQVAEAEQARDADFLWDQAQTRLLTRDYNGARELLGRIAEANPGDIRIAEGMSLVEMRERRDAGAALAAVAASYLDFGNFLAAEQTAREASGRFPESGEIAAVLAQAIAARDEASRDALRMAKESADAGEWRVAADILSRARSGDPASEPLAAAEKELRSRAAAEVSRLLAEALLAIEGNDAVAAQPLVAKAMAIEPESAEAAALARRLAAAVPAVPPETAAAVKAALAGNDLDAAGELAAQLRRDYPSDPTARSLVRDVEASSAQAFRGIAGRLETALSAQNPALSQAALGELEAALALHPHGREEAGRYRSRVAAMVQEAEAVAAITRFMDGGVIAEAWKTCSRSTKVGGAVAAACREVTAAMASRNRELFRQASAAFSAGDDVKARAILSGRFTQVDDPETEELARKVRERITGRIDGYLRGARAAIRTNDRGAAYLAATMALAVDPTSQEAADLQRRAALPDPAKAVADRARELYFLGVTAYTSGDYQGAIRSWREVLLLEPAHEKARRNLDKANRRIRS